MKLGLVHTVNKSMLLGGNRRITLGYSVKLTWTQNPFKVSVFVLINVIGDRTIISS